MLEHLDAIRNEFIDELDKRKKLLDRISELQNEVASLELTLTAIRNRYPMHNYMCKECVWATECINAGNVEGRKQICSSFVAK